MFKQQECIFSPIALIRGNPARAKFAAEKTSFTDAYVHHSASTS